MRTEEVYFAANGGQGFGYLARPDSDEPRPGVVVIQEWWGLDAHIKSIAERFAAEGFVALAPDLYHGKVVPVSEPNEAQKAAMALNREEAAKDIDGAATYLKTQQYVEPKTIGVVGFCMGGGLSMHTAARNPNIGAAVAFYGGGAPGAEMFAHTQAAILNLTAERDERVTSAMKQLDEGLKAYPLPHELVVYPDAAHAFFNDTRPEAYNEKAAQDAWKRTLDWFRLYLK